MIDRRDDKRRTESSPSGPYPEGIGEASGGADSSPYETLASGEKAPAAEEHREVREKRAEPGP